MAGKTLSVKQAGTARRQDTASRRSKRATSPPTKATVPQERTRPVGAATVDDYLAQLDGPARKALSGVRAEIKKAAPQAEERMAYQIPSYYQNGPLIHFAAQPKHLSLYGVDSGALDEVARRFPGIKVVGKTIHFSPEAPLPAGLVQRLVKERVRQNSSRR